MLTNNLSKGEYPLCQNDVHKHALTPHARRLKPRPDPMLSRMVRAAHPVFTRMERSRGPTTSSLSRMVRGLGPQHLRMVPVPAAFRQEPLETGSVITSPATLSHPSVRGHAT